MTDTVQIEILIGQSNTVDTEPEWLGDGIKLKKVGVEGLLNLPPGLILPKTFGHKTIPAEPTPVNGNANGLRYFHVKPGDLARVIRNQTIRRNFLASCKENQITAIVFARNQVLPKTKPL